MFDRTVVAKARKTKVSKETVRAVLTIITRRNRPKNVWVDKGTEFAGELKNYCKAEEKQIYSTMKETEAAFAEPTIRSMKNIVYRYMEGFGYQNIHKWSQFVAAPILKIIVQS